LSVHVNAGSISYEWIENWAQIPDSESARNGWAHPGVAVTERNEIITFHQGDPTILVFDQSGRLLRTIETGVTEGHGLTYTKEDDAEYLWLADPGSKRRRQDGQLQQTIVGGRVHKLTLDGQVVQTLEAPDLEIYRENRYSPTSVAVVEERFGGNGDIWVADGYGQSYVHRYARFDKRGNYLGSINGLEGSAGRFATPHSVWIDYRKTEPELYVADRSNRRVQVYDLEGTFKRVFGTDFLSSPSAFARDGDLLIIAELRARLAVVDREDRLVGYLGANEAVCDADGWPNMKDENGVPTRTNRLQPGRFNGPHGIGADSEGNIYVAEWLIGGRTIKLAKVKGL
jgi:DNA-binding beta-propeller fold protein YncE